MGSQVSSHMLVVSNVQIQLCVFLILSQKGSNTKKQKYCKHYSLIHMAVIQIFILSIKVTIGLYIYANYA